MSRFCKSSHVLWHGQSHLIWVPKDRDRVLTGDVGQDVYNCLQVFAGQQGCEIVELNVQADHVHLIIKIPPRVSVSDFMGTLKGRTAIRLFKKFPYLQQKPYWGIISGLVGIVLIPSAETRT